MSALKAKPESTAKNAIYSVEKKWQLASLGILGFLSLPGFRFALPPDAWDPLWLRFIVGSLCILVTFFSLTRIIARERIRDIAYSILFLITVWLNVILVVNSFRLEYAVTYFVVYLTISLIIQHRFILRIFSIVAVIIPSAIIFFVPEAGIGIPLFVGFSLYSFIVINLLLGSQIRDVKELGEEGQLYKDVTEAAFDASMDAILIVDENGKLQKYNKVFVNLWQFPESVLKSGEARAGIEIVHKKLIDPEKWDENVRAAKADPTLETHDFQFFRDGRVIERYSRPLKLKETQNWRLWYFRDVTASHTVRQEIKNSLALLRAVIEQSELGIVVIAPEKNVLDFNRQYLDIWGMKEEFVRLASSSMLEQFMKSKTLKITGQNDLPGDTVSGGSAKAILEFQDGKVVEQFSATVQATGSGLVQVHFFRDITDSISASREAEKTVNLIRAVFDLSGVGIAVFDENNHAVDFNELYLSIWNLNPEFLRTVSHEEFVEYCHRQLKNPDDAGAAYKRLLSTPGLDEFKMVEFSDGRIVERNTRSIQVGNQFSGRVFFYRDVTEKFRSEEQLRSSEARNRAILTALPDQLLRISGNGITLDYVGKRPFLIQTPQEKIAGKHIREIFGPAIAVDFISRIQGVQDTGMIQIFELTLSEHDGNHSYDARLAKSGAEEVLLILRDTTHSRLTQEQLEQRNFELDSFIYRASHDLKAPLNSIMGLIGLMEMQSHDNTLKRYLSMMDTSVIKLDTFVRNLSNFSKNEKQQIESKPLDINTMIRSALSGLHFLDPENKTLRTIQVSGNQEFYSDPFRIELILSNLFSNALKYQDTSKPEHKIDIIAVVNDRELNLTIRDNGIGIAPEFHSRIFDMFFRGSNQSPGSGMGMYLVRNAIEKLGGTIQLESMPGKGTTWNVRIPQRAAARQA